MAIRLPVWVINLTSIALLVACRAAVMPTPVEVTPPKPPLTILKAVTSRRVDSNYAPTDVTSRFLPREIFYCSILVADVEQDSTIVTRWYFGEELVREISFSIKEQGSGYVAFELTSDLPWPKGVYRVDILSGGIVMRSIEFQVVSEAAN